MEKLDEKEREVFRLRYLMQVSRTEVAEQLGVSTKYVTRHARKAMEQLALLMGDRGDAEPYN